MQKKTMFLMLMLLVAVAAFNVVSNLMMVVKEKAGDIAIIRTMGASTNAVRIIFITHGVLVGAVGVTGGGLGAAAAASIMGGSTGGVVGAPIIPISSQSMHRSVSATLHVAQICAPHVQISVDG